MVNLNGRTGMAQLNQDTQFDVALYSCEEGDCVKIELTGAQSAVMLLTPQEARAFASELIQTVYRAEVKNSLQRKQDAAVEKKSERASSHFGSQPHLA
jgi:hypothetical protein